MKFIGSFLIVFSLYAFNTVGQLNNETIDKSIQFLSFKKIPTWVGVASNWQDENPNINLYDPVKYVGHAEFVSRGLKTGITFKEFKKALQNPKTREYLPFFLFDLEGLDVKVGTQKIDWVIRVEDYEYQDQDDKMLKATLKLLHAIKTHLNSFSKIPTQGAIVLAGNEKTLPNFSITKAIQAKGYPTISLSELIKQCEGVKVEILNEAKAVGYLKLIPSGMNDSIEVTPHNILIYEEAPLRIPPVNGIITLHPQTPLSHINILAKNRGTLNLYTNSLDNLPGCIDNLGKLVQIEIKKEKLYIYPITEEKAQKFWIQQQKKIEIPSINASHASLVNLASNQYTEITKIGAKASNYSKLQKLFPNQVKKGFAIPFYYYQKVIKDGGIDSLIHSLHKETSKSAINLKLHQIREKILHSYLDSNLLSTIDELIEKQYNKSKIRLRSSTNCEDLPEFNGAGLYESKGFKYEDGRAKLQEQILEVYASLWSEIAYWEREFFLIDHKKAGMAILINPAFTNEFANVVAITIPDKKGVTVHINAQFGENAVTNPQNGQLPESITYSSNSSNSIEFTSQSNINPIFYNQNQELLNELKQVITKVHSHFTTSQNKSFGIDIEFKIMNEEGEKKLYIKQSRLLHNTLPE